MDWTGIIIAILTGGTITGAIEAIRYRRENKRLKEAETAKAENEVKDNETDTQMKQMDMADKYFDGMLKMLEQVKNSTESGNVNQKKMMDDLSDIRKRMGVLEESTSNIVAYLNGDYQNWLNNQIRNGRATEEHHCIYGTANRKLSEKYGLKIYLCHWCHNEPPRGLHFNKKLDTEIKQMAQRRFNVVYPDLDFMQIFGRSFL
jgi:hypothetical protein